LAYSFEVYKCRQTSAATQEFPLGQEQAHPAPSPLQTDRFLLLLEPTSQKHGRQKRRDFQRGSPPHSDNQHLRELKPFPHPTAKKEHRRAELTANQRTTPPAPLSFFSSRRSSNGVRNWAPRKHSFRVPTKWMSASQGSDSLSVTDHHKRLARCFATRLLRSTLKTKVLPVKTRSKGILYHNRSHPLIKGHPAGPTTLLSWRPTWHPAPRKASRRRRGPRYVSTAGRGLRAQGQGCCVCTHSGWQESRSSPRTMTRRGCFICCKLSVDHPF